MTFQGRLHGHRPGWSAGQRRGQTGRWRPCPTWGCTAAAAARPPPALGWEAVPVAGSVCCCPMPSMPSVACNSSAAQVCRQCALPQLKAWQLAETEKVQRVGQNQREARMKVAGPARKAHSRRQRPGCRRRWRRRGGRGRRRGCCRAGPAPCCTAAGSRRAPPPAVRARPGASPAAGAGGRAGGGRAGGERRAGGEVRSSKGGGGGSTQGGSGSAGLSCSKAPTPCSRRGQQAFPAFLPPWLQAWRRAGLRWAVRPSGGAPLAAGPPSPPPAAAGSGPAPTARSPCAPAPPAAGRPSCSERCIASSQAGQFLKHAEALSNRECCQPPMHACRSHARLSCRPPAPPAALPSPPRALLECAPHTPPAPGQ